MKYISLLTAIVFSVLLTATPLIATPLAAIDIQSWRYKTSQNQKYNESACLSGFSPLETIYRPIQSIGFSNELSNVRYRFTLIKEVYASEEKSIKRIEFINNPPISSSYISKSCNIRKAFQIENIVFIVHTDVGAFTQELERVYRLYNTAVSS